MKSIKKAAGRSYTPRDQPKPKKTTVRNGRFRAGTSKGSEDDDYDDDTSSGLPAGWWLPG